MFSDDFFCFPGLEASLGSGLRPAAVSLCFPVGFIAFTY